jgi:hypothetical protein
MGYSATYFPLIQVAQTTKRDPEGLHHYKTTIRDCNLVQFEKVLVKLRVISENYIIVQKCM